MISKYKFIPTIYPRKQLISHWTVSVLVTTKCRQGLFH